MGRGGSPLATRLRAFVESYGSSGERLHTLDANSSPIENPALVLNFSDVINSALMAAPGLNLREALCLKQRDKRI